MNDLVEKVIADPACRFDDGLSSRLLDQVRARGHGTEIRRLLKGDDVRLVRIFAWLVAELGPDGGRFSAEIGRLIDHEDRVVRFWAIDSVIATSATAAGAVVARALDHIDDPEDLVRVAAVHLLAAAPARVLASALDYLPRSQVHGALERLRVPEGQADLDEVERRAQGGDLMEALVAVAAAGRLSAVEAEPVLRRIASTTSDGRVASAAHRLLEVAGSWSHD